MPKKLSDLVSGIAESQRTKCPIAKCSFPHIEIILLEI